MFSVERFAMPPASTSAADLDHLASLSVAGDAAFDGMLDLALPTPPSPRSGMPVLADLVFASLGELAPTNVPSPLGLSVSSAGTEQSVSDMDITPSGPKRFVACEFASSPTRINSFCGNAEAAMINRSVSFVARKACIADKRLGSPCANYVAPSARSGSEAASSVVGRGASGAVRVVYHEALQRDVAKKTVRPLNEDRARNAAAELAFAHRAITAAEARPELDVWAHVVEVFEAFHDDDECEAIVVMEYMCLGTASEVPELARRRRSTSVTDSASTFDLASTAKSRSDDAGSQAESPLDSGRHQFTGEQRLDRLARLVRDALCGLRTLHDDLRVIHRDIKPANILLAADGTAKVADFGVAVTLCGDATCATTQAGSALYMSPERLRGDEHDGRSDVWSLGVVALELALGGEFPFFSTAAMPTATERFWAVAERFRVMSPLPESATATGEAVDAALEKACAAFDCATCQPPTQQALDSFRDFVHQCLTADPRERPTAAALLEHPWVA
jgi:serine/threonine protein kinase